MIRIALNRQGAYIFTRTSLFTPSLKGFKDIRIRSQMIFFGGFSHPALELSLLLDHHIELSVVSNFQTCLNVSQESLKLSAGPKMHSAVRCCWACVLMNACILKSSGSKSTIMAASVFVVGEARYVPTRTRNGLQQSKLLRASDGATVSVPSGAKPFAGVVYFEDAYDKLCIFRCTTLLEPVLL